MTDFVVDVVVFDVLGTLVDEPRGLRAAIGAAVPTADVAQVEELLALWQQHVTREQARIVAGTRDFAISDVIDAEAADLVAEAAGIVDRAVIDELAAATRRLPPWPDSVDGLAALAPHGPLVGLSNAGRTTLLRLNAHAGLRWHQALSAEAAGTYKPAAEVYRLAVDVVGVAPDRLLMVAAHARDLRGAQAVGLRTAYVPRPVGDPPGPGDRFDLYPRDLADLAVQLPS